MDRIVDGLLRAWNEFVDILPNLLLFLLILVVGLILSKVAERIVHAVLTRLTSNRYFEETARRVQPMESRDSARPRAPAETMRGRSVTRNVIGVLDKVVYWLGVLFTLYFAFGVFGDNPFSDLLTNVVNFIPKAVVAVFLFVLAAGIANVVRRITKESLGGTSYGPTVANGVGLFILVLGVIAALAQVGIALPVILPLLYFVLLTVAGVAIVGVGGALIPALGPYVKDAVKSLYTEFQENAEGAEEVPEVEPPVEEVEPPVEEVEPPMVEEVPPPEEPPVPTQLPYPPVTPPPAA